MTDGPVGPPPSGTAALDTLEEQTRLVTYERACIDAEDRLMSVAAVLEAVAALTGEPAQTPPAAAGESGPDEWAELTLREHAYAGALAVIQAPVPHALDAFVQFPEG